MEAREAQPVVLVVDDDAEMSEILCGVLQGEGCRVESARSAEEALAAVARFEPEVALLDIVLPGMNGLLLAGKIRARWPDCEVIMITGQTSLHAAIEAIHQEAFDYLTKPFFPLAAVWATVQRALETRRLRMDKRELLDRQRRINAEIGSVLARLQEE